MNNLTPKEKRLRTRQRRKKAKAKGMRIGTRNSVKKVRMVDGHEAVILKGVNGWLSVRPLLYERAEGRCECGCGKSFQVFSMEAHHWKGRARGNRCDCVFHLQALTPECHREAHKHRLGAPFKRGYETTVTRHSEVEI